MAGNGITVYVDDKGLSEKLRSLGGAGGRKAMARSVRKSIPTAEKAVKQAIVSRYELNQKHIVKPYIVRRPTDFSPVAVVHFNQKYENLRSWSGGRVTVTPQNPGNEMRVRPKFVKAHAKRGQSNKALSMKPKPFVARMKNGFVGLFQRSGRWKTGENGHKHEIIVGRAGPAATEAMNDPELQAKVRETVNSQMVKYMQHELDYILKQ